jgi:hypothetical protein
MSKIRIWDVDNLDMIYCDSDDAMKIIMENNIDEAIITRASSYIDSNGNLMYSGDIFRNCQADHNLLFVDCDGEWGYCNHHAGQLPMEDGYELLGNKFKNPELLE